MTDIEDIIDEEGGELISQEEFEEEYYKAIKQSINNHNNLVDKYNTYTHRRNSGKFNMIYVTAKGRILYFANKKKYGFETNEKRRKTQSRSKKDKQQP